jgi:hypothetical protein
MKTSTKKLRVHRETLRIVSGPALRAVVGGGLVEYSGLGGENTAPKSNAWTGEVIDDPLPDVSCSLAG